MNLAVIPARGGSKRLPRKNLRCFAGQPIITWSIKAAFESGLFDQVIVSTDSAEIAAVARDAGAEVPFERPADLSDDHCGTLEVMTHAARWSADHDLAPEAVCCIYATAPFVGAAALAHARIELDSGWDYVFAAAPFAPSVHRSFIRLGTGGMKPLFPEHQLSRSQDLPPVFHDAGQFYWGRLEAWVEARPIFGERTTFIELPPDQVQDIDTPEDWLMAERLFEKIAKARR